MVVGGWNEIPCSHQHRRHQHQPNEYQKLIAALLQQGWIYLETSALIREGDLAEVLGALELLGKRCTHIGVVSAITYHVQGSEDFAETTYPGAGNHQNAETDIKAKQIP